MNTLFPVTVAALLLVSACNKPEPPPEAAAPANETTDTVAAAGAPMADSAAASRGQRRFGQGRYHQQLSRSVDNPTVRRYRIFMHRRATSLRPAPAALAAEMCCCAKSYLPDGTT